MIDEAKREPSGDHTGKFVEPGLSLVIGARPEPSGRIVQPS